MTEAQAAELRAHVHELARQLGLWHPRLPTQATRFKKDSPPPRLSYVTRERMGDGNSRTRIPGRK